MYVEFAVRFKSGPTLVERGSLSMSDWSQDAAAKFQQKQHDENLRNEILKYHAYDQFRNLEEKFTAEIQKFNTASGNKKILNLYPGNDANSFEVNLEGTQMGLRASFNKMKYELSITGMGGPIFTEKLTVRADLQSKGTYLQSPGNQPVEANQVVTRALDALLGI
jgi:hypothetical protein